MSFEALKEIVAENMELSSLLVMDIGRFKESCLSYTIVWRLFDFVCTPELAITVCIFLN